MKELVILSILATSLLCGCEVNTSSKLVTDQCLRREITLELLKNVPKGPERIHNSNDWEEVVKACGNEAYYLSLRPREQIKPECLPY